MQTADEYGRDQQCFFDHRGPRFQFHQQILLVKDTLRPVRSDGLIHQSGLTSFTLPRPDIRLDECNIDDGLYSLLTDIDGQQVSGISDKTAFSPPKLRSIYLRESLDPGHDLLEDLQQYFADINLKRQCALYNEWLPLSSTDNLKDGGLEFSRAQSRWQLLARREIDREKIETSKEAAEMMRFVDADLDYRILRNEDFGGVERGKNCPTPLSLPLSPASSPHLPYIPGPEAIIDLTSEPSSPPNPFVEQLQAEIQDGRLDSDPTAPSSMLTSSPPTKDFRISSANGFKAAELLVDVPLLISSSPNIQEPYFQKFGGSDVAISHEAELPPLDDNRFFEDALMEILKDRQYHASKIVEEDRLNLTDSQLRLQVPTLCFQTAAPDWTTHLSNAKSHLKWLQESNRHVFNLNSLGTLKTIESTLKWAPIPQSHARPSLTEDLGPPGTVSREYLTLQHPELCSADFISRPQTPTILRLSNDEEIDEMLEVDPEFPLRTATQVEEPESIRTGLFGQCDSRNLVTRGFNGKAPLKRKPPEQSSDLLPEPSDSSATSKLLSSFMELRQIKRPRPDSLASHSKTSTPVTMASSPSVQNTFTNKDPVEDMCQARRKPPRPTFSVPEGRHRYHISLNLRPSTIASLEAAWPGLELIDRDFAQYTMQTPTPVSGECQELFSPLSFEADISLSPSSGVIITTLLKVKQKALPGSAGLSPLRIRVERVSAKYEFLFILVSEVNPMGDFIGNPSKSDLAAYEDFTHFTTGLESGVTTYFVSGADETLTQWILSLMCQYAPQAAQFGQFLEVRDSTWETFFRKAGMNIYAAQALSGILYSEFGNLGLAQFLAMETEQRISRYGRIFGGERVLRTVCDRLDREWV